MPEQNLRAVGGREAKRREWTDNRPGAVATMNSREVFAALDGLDIAEEMVKAVLKKPTRRDGFHHCLICGAIGNSPMTISHTADCPVRRWQDWKQGR